MAVQKKRFTKGSVEQKNPEAILPSRSGWQLSWWQGPLAGQPWATEAVLMARNNEVTEKAVSLREPSWVLAEWLWKSVPWPAEAPQERL